MGGAERLRDLAGVIIGTAGHIDHGKTALVQALTGVDTDRLPEEKRRGITIELGFAPLLLDGVGTVGIVDVPGHEAFVRTMLAGATGIDLAMLVIAADEGAMPQTREHLAILSLLGVRGGVVVLTKRDLVDDEWLALVADDARLLVAGSPLEGAEVVSVSATRREGLDELRAALLRAARAIPERGGGDLFRMPVDRAFTVRGTGTVVTGTVWSGTLRRDDSVRLMPADSVARVRSLQRHGEVVREIGAGARAAIALAGLDVADIPRGSALVGGAGWATTTILLAEVSLLTSASRPLDPRTRVRFHLGTADVGARIVSSSGPLAPGSRVPARIILETPLAARAGDRFVLRSPSPSTTIGGGVVEDPLPPHRRARGAGIAETPSRQLVRFLEEASTMGLDETTIPVRIGIAPAEAAAMIAGPPAIALRIGGRIYAPASAEALRTRLRVLLDEHHLVHPLEPGASLQSIRAKLVGSPELIDSVVSEAVGRREVDLDGGVVRRSGWRPLLTSEQEALTGRLTVALREAGLEPPSVGELEVAYGGQVEPLLRLLERARSVVAVEPDRYYDAVVLERLIENLRERMVAEHEYGPAEMREILGVSRKYLIPLLEYCDRVRVTDRRIGGRVISGTQFATRVEDKRS